MESRGTYKVLLSIKLADVIKGALLPEIKSLQLSPDQRTILVGTAASDIYEITTKVSIHHQTPRMPNSLP